MPGQHCQPLPAVCLNSLCHKIDTSIHEQALQRLLWCVQYTESKKEAARNKRVGQVSNLQISDFW